VHRQAAVPGGDIEVRLDTCDGELLATLPLESATNGTSTLTASLPPREGVHALCFAVAASKLDPIWGIDHVRLIPRAMPGGAN
jgi:hexosaminidase